MSDALRMADLEAALIETTCWLADLRECLEMAGAAIPPDTGRHLDALARDCGRHRAALINLLDEE